MKALMVLVPRCLRTASWAHLVQDPVDWAIASLIFCTSLIFSMVLLALSPHVMDHLDSYFEGIRRVVASTIH